MRRGRGGGRLFLAGGGQPMGVSPSPWGWGGEQHVAPHPHAHTSTTTSRTLPKVETPLSKVNYLLVNILTK